MKKREPSSKRAEEAVPADGVPSPVTRQKLDSILGRVADYMPSDTERAELYRWVSALGIHENDALLLVVAFMARSGWVLRQYPDRLEQVGKDVVKRASEAVDEVAKKVAEKAVLGELKKVRPGISEALREALAAIAKEAQKAHNRVPSVVVGLWLAAISVVFGGFFLLCGFELGRGHLPFWMRPEVAQSGSAVAKVTGAILGAPAGYWALCFSFVAMAMTVKDRVLRFRTAAAMTSVQKWTAIGSLALSVGGWLCFAICLAVLVGSPFR